MALDKKYYIHSRGGTIGQNGLSSPEDIDAIVAHLKQATPRNLILHFHGGLVSQEAGFKIAEALLPVYQPGGHPVFYVWESGAWETIRNNLTELADEPVFQQLLRKLLEYALQRLGGTNGSRSIQPGRVNPDLVKKTLRNFFENPGPDSIPYKDFVPMVQKADARSAADAIDTDEIQADLEGDQDFKDALTSLPDIPPGRRSALQPVATIAVRNTPFAQLASTRLSELPDRRGLITLLRAALLIKDVLVGVLRRYHAGRDHALYATVVEEIVRAFKVGGSAVNEWGKALEWNRMKKDCADAFLPGADRYAGTALLTRIRDRLSGGTALNRITLIGHSTGGVYICAWLEAADFLLAAGVRMDVVLLAPAVTYARFAAALTKYGHRIRSFRMFAMSDALERDDQVWGNDPALPGGKDWRRFLYPSSLLYLVSGILESKPAADGTLSDEPDMPLLGMQRYFSNAGVYSADAFPEVVQVRNWLNGRPNAMVWSFADSVGSGLNSHCNDHGQFDDEQETLSSLQYIVTSGF